MTKTTADNEGQGESKSAKNKGVTSTQIDDPTPSKKPSEVSTDDNPNTIKVTRSDKLNNKLSDKPDTDLDADLSDIVKAWPELPDVIRSAIVAIVRTSIG